MMEDNYSYKSDEEEAGLDDIRDVVQKSGWQADEEAKLIEYYSIFKDSDDCPVKISKILNKDIEAVVEKLKEKKLYYGEQRKKNQEDNKDNSKSNEDKLATKELIKELIRKKYDHKEIIDILTHMEKVTEDYLENEAKSNKDDM